MLFIQKRNPTFWQLFTGRSLHWTPLSDTKIKTVDSGTTAGGGWWYSFKSKVAAVEGKREFARVNAKESHTFTASIRERKTTTGLG